MPARQSSDRRSVPGRHPHVVVAVLTACSLLVAGAAQAAVVADRFAPRIEAYPVYAGQETCSPTAKPGTRQLAAWLMRTYPGTGSSGIVRACSAGGRSEHKEGRAFDWKVNYYNARQRAHAQDFLRQLTATDRHGNKYALARRMGVMYAIWDNRIFSMTGPGWKPYRGASAHRDHVHISLNWNGALARTSFYSGKVVDTAPPLLRPAPKPKPKPGVRQPAVPPVLDQSRTPDAQLSVGVSGAEKKSRFSLKAGRTYRLVATGLYRYGTDPAQIAGPMCGWAPEDDRGWAPGGGGDLRPPPLTVNGEAQWRARSGGTCDTGHTYVWDYRPATTGPVSLRLPDSFAADNRGKLSVHVLRAGADPSSVQVPAVPPLAPEPAADAEPDLGGWTLISEQVSVPADSPGGVRTTGVLTQGVPYEVVVRGTYEHGHGSADAECSTRDRSPTWRRWGSTHPRHPDADTLDFYIDGNDFSGRPGGDEDEHCDEDSVYRGWHVPTRTGRATLAIWDPQPGDNQGALTVDIRRAGWPQRPGRAAPVTTGPALQYEQIVVPGGSEGVLTNGVLQAGVRYQIRVTGQWSYGPGAADTECSTAPGRPEWRRYARDNGFGEDLFDLHLNGNDFSFAPVGPAEGNCSLSHTYTGRYRQWHNGPLSLAVWGLEHRDATGGLTVEIWRL